MFNLFKKNKKISLLEQNILNMKEFIKENPIRRMTLCDTSKDIAIEHKVEFLNWNDYIEIINPFDTHYYEENDLIDVYIVTDEFNFKCECRIIKIEDNLYYIYPETYFEKSLSKIILVYEMNEIVQLEIENVNKEVILNKIDKTKCIITSNDKIELNNKVSLITNFIEKNYIIKGFIEKEEIEGNNYIYTIYFSTKEFNTFILFNYLMKKERYTN